MGLADSLKAVPLPCFFCKADVKIRFPERFFSGHAMSQLYVLLLLVTMFFSPALSQSAQAEELVPYQGALIDDQRMSENLCALTFDDGPGPFTAELLDMLDGYGIRATFFMLGRNASRFPDIVQRALAEGHEVENHSYSHPNMKTLGVARRMEEMGRTNEILRSLGAEPSFLRPPYGSKDSALTTQAAELGLRIITWSRDSLDWKRLPDDYSQLPDCSGRIAPKGHLRGIFLFHDIHKRTVEDLPRIVAQLKAGGCQRFVTVREYVEGFYQDYEPPVLMTRHPRADTKAAALAASGAVSGAASAGTTAPEGSLGSVSAAHAAETGSLPPAAANIPDLGSKEGTLTIVSSWPDLAIDDPSVLLLAEKKQKQESAFAFLRSAEDDAPSYKPHTWKADDDQSPFRLGEVVQEGNGIYIFPVVKPAPASPETPAK